jgi:hypothetical protein
MVSLIIETIIDTNMASMVSASAPRQQHRQPSLNTARVSMTPSLTRIIDASMASMVPLSIIVIDQ